MNANLDPFWIEIDKVFDNLKRIQQKMSSMNPVGDVDRFKATSYSPYAPLSVDYIEKLGWKTDQKSNIGRSTGFVKDNLVLLFSDIGLIHVIFRDPSKSKYPNPEQFRIIMACRTVEEFDTLNHLLNRFL